MNTDKFRMNLFRVLPCFPWLISTSFDSAKSELTNGDSKALVLQWGERQVELDCRRRGR